MRNQILILFLVGGVIFGQNVQVTSNQPITNINQGKFFYPQVSPSGEHILLTSENHDGIWMYNTINGKIDKIVDASGAGYEPMISTDGEEIVYRESEYINNRKYSSLHKYNIKTQSTELIEQRARNVSTPLEKTSNTITYVVEKELIEKNVSKNLQKNENSQTLVTIENSDLVIYSKGERKVYTPLGKGNYLWPSISPDGTKLLFTFAGKGSFVADFEGNIITELSNAHYPNWSNDSKWIVYMKDFDDGYVITSSEIHVVSVDGTIDVKLTETENIHEMYPSWSPVANEIVYNTTDGIIYKLKLKID
ncbi:MAG: hypothetical protein ABFS12_15950 [Bacteroidota bacterium]